MPLAGARRAPRQQALPHDPGPRPCGRRALRHPRRRAGPLQGEGRLPLVAEADHVGLITRIWYKTFARLTSMMIKERVSAATFAAAFATQRGDTVRFPTDTEFCVAIHEKTVSN